MPLLPANASTTARVSQVEPSSATIISSGATVCLSMLSSESLRASGLLYVVTIMLVEGVLILFPIVYILMMLQ